MDRQPNFINNTCPSDGARAGTNTNIAIAKDMTCAIFRPEYKSRIRAIVTVRGAETPKPWTNLAKSIISNDFA